MSRITNYPETDVLEDNDIFILDGDDGTRIISAENLSKEIAEKSGLNDEIAELKDDLRDSNTGYEFLDIEWINGRINDDGTLNTTPTNWCVFKYMYVPIVDTTLFINKGGSNHVIQIAIYNADDTLKSLNYDVLTSDIVAYTIPAGFKVRFCGRKSDSSVLNPDYFKHRFKKFTAQHINDRIAENGVYQLGECREPDAFSSDFYLGNMSQGGFFPLTRQRVYSGLMSYDHPVNIKASDGYSFVLEFYSNGEYVSETGFNTSYSIPANQQFRILIKYSDESSSYIANIDELKRKISFYRSLETVPYDYGYFTNGKMKIISHTGLHPGTIIGQSKPAYINAGKNGQWACECDARATSDGVYICMHNATVDATTNGSGTVSEMTFSDIEELYLLNTDSSVSTEKVPTVDEFLQICKQYGMVAFIEIKDITIDNFAYVQPVINMIKKWGMESQTIIIVSPYRVNVVRALCDFPIAVLADDTTWDLAISRAETYKNCLIDYNSTNTVNSTKIESCHNKKIPFGVFTINSKATADIFWQLGCDFITSDGLTFNDWASS